jgi:hypothetical protein
MKLHHLAGIAALALALAGCGQGSIGSGAGSLGSGPGSIGSGAGTADPAVRSEAADRNLEAAIESQNQQYDIPAETFLDLFRGGADPGREINVNRYLWSASLDILSFLPLERADPFSGLIVTDWGRVGGDGAPYRVTVLINAPDLDATSLKVAGFRQQGGRAVPIAEADNRRLEDAILTRARQLRIAGSRRGS